MNLKFKNSKNINNNIFLGFLIFSQSKKLKETKEENIQMRKTTRQAGITLIALIVTIVILLILVGISIGILTGENGLIKNARKCKRTNRHRK